MERCYAKTRAQAEQLDTSRVRWQKDASDMLKAAVGDQRRAAGRRRALAVYASLQGRRGHRVASAQERRSRLQALQTMIAEKTAWWRPRSSRSSGQRDSFSKATRS